MTNYAKKAEIHKELALAYQSIIRAEAALAILTKAMETKND